MPEDEKFGLTGQIRKSSVSVPSNIAEGASRKSEKDRKWFYQIARSSLVELDTQIILALNLGYLTSEQTENTGKMINEIFAILSKMVCPPTSAFCFLPFALLPLLPSASAFSLLPSHFCLLLSAFSLPPPTSAFCFLPFRRFLPSAAPVLLRT